MCIPRTNRIFRTISERNRPWITVVDGFGFPDPWVNAYVTFLAWQDATPYHVRRQAAILAEAATWLTQNGCHVGTDAPQRVGLLLSPHDAPHPTAHADPHRNIAPLLCLLALVPAATDACATVSRHPPGSDRMADSGTHRHPGLTLSATLLIPGFWG